MAEGVIVGNAIGKDAREQGADVYMHVSTHVTTDEEVAVLGVLYSRNDIFPRFWE